MQADRLPSERWQYRQTAEVRSCEQHGSAVVSPFQRHASCTCPSQRLTFCILPALLMLPCANLCRAPEVDLSCAWLELICVPAEFGIAPTTPGRGSQLSPPFKLVAPNSDMKEIPATFVVSPSIKMQRVLLLCFSAQCASSTKFHFAAHNVLTTLWYSF